MAAALRRTAGAYAERLDDQMFAEGMLDRIFLVRYAMLT